MRASVSDLRLQARAVHYLRANPGRRVAEICEALALTRPTCQRLLVMLMNAGRITCETYNIGGLGPPPKLWSAAPADTYVSRMSAEEMAAEIEAIVALQPWPVWMIVPNRGTRPADAEC